MHRPCHPHNYDGQEENPNSHLLGEEIVHRVSELWVGGVTVGTPFSSSEFVKELGTNPSKFGKAGSPRTERDETVFNRKVLLSLDGVLVIILEGEESTNGGYQYPKACEGK